MNLKTGALKVVFHIDTVTDQRGFACTAQVDIGRRRVSGPDFGPWDKISAGVTVTGEIINNYRLSTVLGQGGMGTVYLAEHSFMGRRAAVKVLRREFAEDANVIERFMNEARAANAIRHPNIIDIIDVGRMPSGIPYLMMEFLEGESLAQRLERTRQLPLDEAVDIALQTAGALEAAHTKGIVHRDLKPDNLFLVPDEARPRGERVKVLDFGIAKLRGELATGSAQTQAGSLMGTPLYMSPEQGRGLTAAIDHRTDIYALGVILYEMLNGAPPFQSPGWGDLVVMHITRAPTPLRIAHPEIPPAVEAVVMKALEKEPAARFASMAELATTLRRARNPSFPSAEGHALDTLRPRERAAISTTPSGAMVGDVAPDRRAVAAPPTAFETASGEIGIETLPAARVHGSRATKWVMVGVGVALAASVALMVIKPRRPTPAAADERTATSALPPSPPVEPAPRPRVAEEPTKAAAPASVHLKLTSRPLGAQVIDEAGDKVLGVTPVELTQPRRSGVIDLRLEKTGFAPSRVSVALDRDFEDTIALDAPARASSKPTASAPKTHRPSAKPAAVKLGQVSASPVAAPTAPPAAPDVPKPKPKVEKW